MNSVKLKCVVVGDGYVGKTCMLKKYATTEFSEGLIYQAATLFDHHSIFPCVHGELVNLELWDTGGYDGCERVRQLCYPRADVFILCFSLVTPASFENVRYKWFPEIKNLCPNASIVLVGTKMDLRDNKCTPKKKVNSIAKGRALAKDIGAAKYVECSAMSNIGIEKVFHEAVRIVLYPPSTLCNIL